MIHRVICGMGANSFGMAMTIVIQLVPLQLYLLYWDTATYGTWLMLSAIPAYLSITVLVLLMATNQHLGLLQWSLLAATLTVGLAWLLASQFQLNGVGASMLVSELFIAIICSIQAYSAIASSRLTTAVPQ